MYQDIICLPTKYLLTIIIIFIAFSSLFYFEKNNKYYQINQPIKQIPTEIETKLYLNNRDADVLYNEFAPPERREPEYQYPNKYLRNRFDIPTRGTPDNYQLLGVLLRNNTETAYKLFGRQIYPSSSQYEYYALGVMDNNEIKLPIKTRGDREIEDNQVVMIPGTDVSKGEFRVKLYNFNAPRYI